MQRLFRVVRVATRARSPIVISDYRLLVTETTANEIVNKVRFLREADLDNWGNSTASLSGGITTTSSSNVCLRSGPSPFYKFL